MNLNLSPRASALAVALAASLFLGAFPARAQEPELVLVTAHAMDRAQVQRSLGQLFGADFRVSLQIPSNALFAPVSYQGSGPEGLLRALAEPLGYSVGREASGEWWIGPARGGPYRLTCQSGTSHGVIEHATSHQVVDTRDGRFAVGTTLPRLAGGMVRLADGIRGDFQLPLVPGGRCSATP